MTDDPGADPIDDCVWCELPHGRRHMCDPVLRYLDAMIERAKGFNMPVLEFVDTPIEPRAEADDVYMRQFVVQAGTAEVAGTKRPLIIITGQDQAGAVLPRWTYVGTTQDIIRARNLFDRMCSLAIDAVRRP